MKLKYLCDNASDNLWDRFYNKMEWFIRTYSKYESIRLMYQLRNNSMHLIIKEQKTTFDFTGISHRKIRLFMYSLKNGGVKEMRILRENATRVFPFSCSFLFIIFMCYNFRAQSINHSMYLRGSRSHKKKELYWIVQLFMASHD